MATTGLAAERHHSYRRWSDDPLALARNRRHEQPHAGTYMHVVADERELDYAALLRWAASRRSSRRGS